MRTLPTGTTPEQFAEIAAIRAEVKPLLDRLKAMGAEPQSHGNPETQLEEAWLSMAETYDTLGPYGCGEPTH